MRQGIRILVTTQSKTTIAHPVEPLPEFLAAIGHFRLARGRHYEPLSILLFACVAMLCSAPSGSALTE